MKAILAAISFVVSLSNVSQACTQLEAQFIGQVKEITRAEDGSNCLVQIKFESYESSIMCPLDIEDVIDQKVVSRRCDLKVGDAVSGILVNDGSKTYIE